MPKQRLATLTGICFRGLRHQETFTNDALFEMLKTYTEENGCKVNCCDVAAACRCFRKER